MTVDDRAFQLLLEYFRSLRTEIEKRIDEHSNYVWIKLVAIGTMLVFLVGSNPAETHIIDAPLAYIVWALPLSASIFDFMIGGNLQATNRLGKYIKEQLEEKAFVIYSNSINDTIVKANAGNPDFGFWEESVAQANGWRMHSKVDMFVIWLFTFASWLFSIPYRMQTGLDSMDFVLALGTFFVITVAAFFLVKSISVPSKREMTAGAGSTASPSSSP